MLAHSRCSSKPIAIICSCCSLTAQHHSATLKW
jgi:hypothetical protein